MPARHTPSSRGNTNPDSQRIRMSSEKKAHQFSVLIYLSFIASIMILFIVGQMMAKNLDLRKSTDFNIPGWELRYLFYGLSVVVIIVTRHLKSFLFNRAKGKGREECLQRTITAVTITASLCEIPALLGLFNLLTGGLRQDFLLLLGLSLLLLTMHFPRPFIYEECARQHVGSVSEYDVSEE